MIPKIKQGMSFAGLAKYLQKGGLHTVLAMNEVSSVADAALEMELVADGSERVRTPVLHVSLSYDVDDESELTPDVRRKIRQAVLEAIGVSDHQWVAIDHHDRPHPHEHLMANKINCITGRSPPDRPFLKPKLKSHQAVTTSGDIVPGVHPNIPLTPEQAAKLDPHLVETRNWDSHLLTRLQRLCRRLEREYGLRRLRLAEEAAAERLSRTLHGGDDLAIQRPELISRELQTGARPLSELSELARRALDCRTWSEKARALRELDLTVEPFFIPGKPQTVGNVRGLRLVDLQDPGNYLKLSALGPLYGYRAIEQWTEGPSFFEWWSDPARVRGRLSTKYHHTTPCKLVKQRDTLRTGYENDLALRRDMITQRRNLRKKEQEERDTLEARLSQERAAFVRSVGADRGDSPGVELNRDERMLAARLWDELNAAPKRQALAQRQAQERSAAGLEGRLPPQLTWLEWLAERAVEGGAAANVLTDLLERSRQRKALPLPPAQVLRPNLRDELSDARVASGTPSTLRALEPARMLPAAFRAYVDAHGMSVRLRDELRRELCRLHQQEDRALERELEQSLRVHELANPKLSQLAVRALHKITVEQPTWAALKQRQHAENTSLPEPELKLSYEAWLGQRAIAGDQDAKAQLNLIANSPEQARIDRLRQGMHPKQHGRQIEIDRGGRA